VSGVKSISCELCQQKLRELNAVLFDVKSELEKVCEVKQQMERDYNEKCQAFQSLSAEFLAAKVSFEVSRRFIYCC